MTDAHLGDRGACRRRSCSATAPPPAKAAGATAMVMGTTTHGRSAAFFHQILIDASEALQLYQLPKLCSWTTPTASKAALPREGAIEASRRREMRSEAQQRRRSSGGAAVSLRRAVLEDDRRGRGDEQEREENKAERAIISRVRRGRRAARHRSPPCQMRFDGRWRHTSYH